MSAGGKAIFHLVPRLTDSDLLKRLGTKLDDTSATLYRFATKQFADIVESDIDFVHAQ